MGKESELHDILSKANIQVSRKELGELYRDYNNFSGPLNERIQKIIDDPKPFIKFIENKKILTDKKYIERNIESIVRNDKKISSKIRLNNRNGGTETLSI